MRNVREQIEDAAAGRQGDLEEAQITREHVEAARLLGALPGMTHQERYAADREPRAERGPEAAAGREDPEAGS